MKRARASDEAFVQEMMAEPQVPPPPADWDQLADVLHELNTAPPGERDELFARATRFAGDNEAAHSLIDGKRRDLGIARAANE